MGKITSKYQVSIPKALAEQLQIAPGDAIDWRIVGNELRISAGQAGNPLPVEERLRLFDEATRRLTSGIRKRRAGVTSRGWTREDLYDRGRPR